MLGPCLLLGLMSLELRHLETRYGIVYVLWLLCSSFAAINLPSPCFPAKLNSDDRDRWRDRHWRVSLRKWCVQKIPTRAWHTGKSRQKLTSICERNYKITTLHCLSYSSGHHEGPRNLDTKDYTFLTSLQKTSKSQCQPVIVIRCRMKITLACHSLVDLTPSVYHDLWEISLSNGDSISWHTGSSIKTNFNHTIPIFPLQDASLPATQEVPTFPQEYQPSHNMD